MRNLLRAGTGIAALAGLAWVMLPQLTAPMVHPAQSQTMLARSVVIVAAFLVGWASLSLVPDRPVALRDIAAPTTLAALILIGISGVVVNNRYQERQAAMAQSARTFEECKQLTQSKPAANLTFDLDAWLNCDTK